MAKQEFWINEDGLRVRFNGGEIESAKPGKTCTSGFTDELVLNFDFVAVNEGRVGADATDEALNFLNAGAVVTEAILQVSEAFVGDTLSVGTDVTATAFFAAAGGAVGTFYSDENYVVGSVNEFLTVVATAAGTLTAGAAVLKLKYAK